MFIESRVWHPDVGAGTSPRVSAALAHNEYSTSEESHVLFLFLMCFESEARGSRRNMQPSPAAVRLTVNRKEKAKAKLRHLLPHNAHSQKR